jgi:hydroxymethylglutaryl-CoA lyase/(R)-citramalyl-CoA lyase
VSFALAATESFSQRNAGASVEESVAAAERIAGRAGDEGIRVSLTISVAFGCPFEGRVDPGRVAELAERLAATRPNELVLADTIGVATPTRVRQLIERVSVLGVPVGGHFHNTRNTGYANAYAALDAGVSLLDASVGGLGGCPFAPKATGNVATEDLVYLLDGEGVQTGVDLEAVIAVSQWLEQLLGRQLEGYVYRAGPFRAQT